jgi:hypothetical protein
MPDDSAAVEGFGYEVRTRQYLLDATNKTFIDLHESPVTQNE